MRRLSRWAGHQPPERGSMRRLSRWAGHQPPERGSMRRLSRWAGHRTGSTNLDLDDPLHPLEPAAVGGDQAARGSVAARQRLAGDVGRQ
jgi:hypothetical protein